MSLSQRYLFVVVKRNVRNFVSMFRYISVGSVRFDFIDESKALCFFMSSVFACRQPETRRRNSGRKYVHTGFSFKKIDHHHHHISVMELGHLFTRSGLTCVKKVFTDVKKVLRFKYASWNIRGLGEKEEELDKILNENNIKIS